ncbi:MAG TPA: transglycosylase domain-containing protein, partial [Hymenobacter sp.]
MADRKPTVSSLPSGTKPSVPRRRWPLRLVRWAWVLFGGVIVFFLVYPFLVSTNFMFLFGKSPSLADLENPKVEQASELYTSDGVLIGKYFRENRSPVPLSQMSPLLIKALIATEDVRYYEHSGIDLTAVLGGFYSSLQGDKRGGSTITQQLAKNLYKIRREQSRGVLGYIPVVSTIVAKTKEWLTAVELERHYTKEEILRMYLNTVEYGSSAFGIKVAAKTFFSTSPDSLKPEEAAMLVAVLNNPTAYNPRFHPAAALRRRNVVLDRMGQAKVLPPAQIAALKATPIVLNYHVERHIDGPDTYFRSAISQFVDAWCDSTGHDMYRDGLKIYLTIDSRMQAHAEQALHERMKSLQRTFDNFWRNRRQNPWVDDKGNEIPDFIETQMKRTEGYKTLAARYKNQPQRLDSALNAKRPMKVFTWKHKDNDTTLVLSPLDSLAYYKHFLQAGMLSMDPFTGHIKAW